MNIRFARLHEAEALTSLAMKSKAHWGYDAEFMRAAAVTLAVKPSAIVEERVLVAEDADAILGVAGIESWSADTLDVSHLFVSPHAMRRGIGTKLFFAAVDLARSHGWAKLRILSDPNAAQFYQRLGAARIGDAPSDVIANRNLPLFEFRIV